MSVPSREDWGEPCDLDAEWAMKVFLGKTQEEAERLFESNALNYGEDIQYMPSAAFNYYVPALIRYLLSERAEGDSDGASSFLRRVLWMLQTSPERLAGMRNTILVAAEQVASRQAFYDADESIYGRFDELLADIQRSAQHGI
jgi:hypothetical protein